MKHHLSFFAAILILSIITVPACKTKKSSKNVILFEDTFSEVTPLNANRIIHNTGYPSEGPSNWVIEDGRLLQKSNIYRGGEDEYDHYEGTHAVTKQGKDWQDYTVSVDYIIQGDDDGVGVLFRYQDPDHYYRFITLQDPGNKGPFRKLQGKDGDRFITLAESKAGYDPAVGHKTRVKAVQDPLTVCFDDKEIFSADDSHFPTGRSIGLMCYAEQPVFDNVLVQAAH